MTNRVSESGRTQIDQKSIDDLRARLKGPLILPVEPGYDPARAIASGPPTASTSSDSSR